MALFAHPIGLGKPCSYFAVDIFDAGETKGVQMVSRRESFDPAEARILQASREDNVAVHPVFPDYERREAHADVKRDSGLLRQHRDRSIVPRDRQQPIENRAGRFRFTREMRGEG